MGRIRIRSFLSKIADRNCSAVATSGGVDAPLHLRVVAADTDVVVVGVILIHRVVNSSSGEEIWRIRCPLIQPIDYNPCLECKLCVAACPVGAISPEGDFNFSACYSHNYREFMGGFTDWAEEVADSKNRFDYRKRISDPESASMWQSLSYGANYKAAYCLSVCPAGEDVIAPYLADKTAHLNEIVKPLKEKQETVYVLRNSDAEDHVARRFPKKRTKHVGNSLRPTSVREFLNGVPLVFQPGKSAGLNAIYHFTFTGNEDQEATIVIADKTITVEEGHRGKPDLHVTADARTWIGFLRKERNIVWAIFRRKVRLKGPLKLLLAFGKCFPG